MRQLSVALRVILFTLLASGHNAVAQGGCPLPCPGEIGDLIANTYGDKPTVVVERMHYVCKVFGEVEYKYTAISVLAKYTCSGTPCRASLEQFDFSCTIQGEWKGAQGATETAHVVTQNSTAEFNTPERTNCGMCVNQQLLNVLGGTTLDYDEQSHCVVSSTLCHEREDCEGMVHSAPDKTACCVGRDSSLSYSENGNCTVPECRVHGFDKAFYVMMEGSTLDGKFKLNAKGQTTFSRLLLFGSIEPSDSRFTNYTGRRVEVNNGFATIDLHAYDDDIPLEDDATVILSFSSTLPTLVEMVVNNGEFVRDNVTVFIQDNDATIDIVQQNYVFYNTVEPPIRMDIEKIPHDFNVVITPVSINDAIASDGSFNVGSLINSQLAEAAIDFSGASYTHPIVGAICRSDKIDTIELPIEFSLGDISDDDCNKSFALVVQVGDKSPLCKFGGENCTGRITATAIRIYCGPEPTPSPIPTQSPSPTQPPSPSPTQSPSPSPTPSAGAVVNLEIPTNNVNEDEGPAIVCAVVVGPNTTCPFQNNFAVSISTNATLEESLDFRPLSSVVFFAPCEKRNCTEVNIIDDMQVELVESFAVTMQRTPGLTSAITFEQDGGRISITDDDVAVVGLETSVYSVTEDDGVVEVCAVVLSPIMECPIDFAFTVILSTSDDSAVTTEDYISMSTTLSFDKCERRSCVNIDIEQDERLEKVEVFNIILERTNDLDDRITLVDGVVEITDTSKAEVSLMRTTYTVNEEDGLVEVCAVVFSPDIRDRCPIEFPFNVSFSTGDSTAVASADYVAVKTILSFGECHTVSCINITIKNDVILEPLEVFNVSLVDKDLDEGITLKNVDGVVMISDSDVAVVGLENSVYSVTEDDGVVEVCAVVQSANMESPNMECPIDFAFTVILLTSDDSAVTSEDYTVESPIFSFGKCERRSCVNIDVVQDERLENAEVFNISLEKTNDLDERITPDKEDGVVKINDSSAEAVLSLMRTTYTVNERDGFVEVCAVVFSPDIRCPIEFPFNVRFSTRDSTAVASADYVAVSTILSFGKCDWQSCINITIKNDVILEPSEVFNVSLMKGDTDGRFTFQDAEGVVKINDSGVPEVGLEKTIYVTDPKGKVELCAKVRSGSCPSEVSANFTFTITDDNNKEIKHSLTANICSVLCVKVSLNVTAEMELKSFDVTLTTTSPEIRINPAKKSAKIYNSKVMMYIYVPILHVCKYG